MAFSEEDNLWFNDGLKARQACLRAGDWTGRIFNILERGMQFNHLSGRYQGTWDDVFRLASETLDEDDV